MSSRRALGGLLALIILSGLVACGPENLADSGGTGGTGVTAVVSSGPITEIGSIWVNGVEYDTTGATIMLPGVEPFVDIEGTTGGDLLHEGMLVTVEGEVDATGLSGTAQKVTYHRSLIGPVDAVDVDQYTVLGQQVGVSVTNTLRTRFRPAAWRPAMGEWVEVSGYALTDGTLHASYIAQLDAVSVVVLKGPITAINDDGSIIINGSTHVVLPTGQSADQLAIGMEVEVKGYWSDGVLTADAMSSDDLPAPAYAGEEVEVSGMVVQLWSDTEFTVSGVRVRVDAATLYEGGTAADLQLRTWVAVKGTMAADGVVLAQQITFAAQPDATPDDGAEPEGGSDENIDGGADCTADCDAEVVGGDA
jgi:hypothetical protein